MKSDRYYRWVELSHTKYFLSSWDYPTNNFVVIQRVAELKDLEEEFGIFKADSWQVKRTQPYNECSCGNGIGPEYEYSVGNLKKQQSFTLANEDEACSLVGLLEEEKKTTFWGVGFMTPSTKKEK